MGQCYSQPNSKEIGRIATAKNPNIVRDNNNNKRFCEYSAPIKINNAKEFPIAQTNIVFLYVHVLYT